MSGPDNAVHRYLCNYCYEYYYQGEVFVIKEFTVLQAKEIVVTNKMHLKSSTGIERCDFAVFSPRGIKDFTEEEK